MVERVRAAARWVVVAVLAVLALVSTRGTSAPTLPPPAAAVHHVAPDVVPAAPVVSVPVATAQAAPHAADAVATVADVSATCAVRAAAVEQLRAAGEPAAIPVLTAAARRDDCVAAAARAAVRALGRRETAAY